MKILSLSTLAVLLLLAACSLSDSKSETKSILELDIPSDFDFSMEKTINLDIELLTNQSEPVPNVVFDVYYVNAQNDNNFICNIKTDAEGMINSSYQVPTYVEKLFITGFMNSQTLDIINNTASYYFGPELTDLGTFMPPSTSRNFSYLPDIQYNYQGVPYPTTTYTVTADMLQRINTSLPESVALTESHPQYLADGITTNLVIEDSSDVWLTFVTEGAGYRNALGFYTYDQETGPPADPEELEHFIVFPNCSLTGSGGGMQSGMQLYLGRFGAGTIMGWFIVQNGWINGLYVDEDDLRFYSDSQYNPEEDEEYKQHSVLLFDAESEFFLLAFDDQVRPDGGDNDFNDAVFFATANPIENINTDNIPPIDIPVDTDGDGVNDPFDEYPDDPLRAFNLYYPSQNDSSTIVFEDKWPNYGDYDMNDMVIDYQYHLVTNADNEIKDVNTLFSLRAAGASYNNGFSVLLPFANSNLTIVDNSDNISPALIAENDFAILDLFQNTTTITGLEFGFFNTAPQDPYYAPVDFYCAMILTNPVLAEDLEFSFPYNPFIKQGGNNAHEIHLLDLAPTLRMNYDLFMTGDDASDPENGSWFVSPLNLPWALNLPESWQYPAEKNSIVEVYYQFADWAESGGVLYPDWYLFSDDNVDMNKVYQTP
ncbi:MAG: LruC domain-containing protein [Candidatus Cloacimonetes bacterium]|nr:LruC domain-containing protein [Candidatus Cloacimonadota bacterium]